MSNDSPASSFPSTIFGYKSFKNPKRSTVLACLVSAQAADIRSAAMSRKNNSFVIGVDRCPPQWSAAAFSAGSEARVDIQRESGLIESLFRFYCSDRLLDGVVEFLN